MGVVLEARQMSLDRKVAIKVLAPNLVGRPGFAQRFEREATTLARLNHPHIVSIYDRGHHGDLLYFVMEYIEAPEGNGPRDLRHMIQAGRLDSETTHKMILQVIRALGYAHAQGVIHRDIKPSNVMLDRHGNVKVTDFGIASLAAALDPPSMQLTLSGVAVGTFGYMAPEQRRNAAQIDQRADVYSVGVLLYEMLTGELAAGAYLPPSQLVPGLSVGWDETVARALHPKPEGRFPDMAAFAAALESTALAPAAKPPIASGAIAAVPTATLVLPCAECGVAVVSQGRFCGGCGKPLWFACPTCQNESRVGVRFCPSCRTNLEAIRLSEEHQGRAREFMGRANSPGPASERWPLSDQAVQNLTAALALASSDSAMAGELANARRLTIELLAAAAEEAMGQRRYSQADEHFRQLLVRQPDHVRAARAVAEIARLRENHLRDAKVKSANGEFSRALQVLAALQRSYDRDGEIESLIVEVGQQRDFVTDIVEKQLPAMKAAKQYVAIAGVLRQVQDLNIRLGWLDNAVAKVRQRLERVEPHVEEGRRCLREGRFVSALQAAQEVLVHVADHAEAKQIAKRAQQQVLGLHDTEARLKQALAARRWFKASRLLALARRRGIDPHLFSQLVSTMNSGVARAQAFARLLTWTVLGAILIALTLIPADLFASGLGGALPDRPLVVTALRANALRSILVVMAHGAFLVLLLIALVSLLQRRSLFDRAIAVVVRVLLILGMAGASWVLVMSIPLPLLVQAPPWSALVPQDIVAITVATAIGAAGCGLIFGGLVSGLSGSVVKRAPLIGLAVIGSLLTLVGMVRPAGVGADLPGIVALCGLLAATGLAASKHHFALILSAGVVGALVESGAGAARTWVSAEMAWIFKLLLSPFPKCSPRIDWKWFEEKPPPSARAKPAGREDSCPQTMSWFRCHRPSRKPAPWFPAGHPAA